MKSEQPQKKKCRPGIKLLLPKVKNSFYNSISYRGQIKNDFNKQRITELLFWCLQF